jgi:glycolate oxidase iron-sulfur subunit
MFGRSSTINPGWLLQLMNGLPRRGLNAMPTFHMIELLDASIRNIPADTLLGGDKTSPIDANWSV